MSIRIKYIISELKDQYLIEDNLRPWIIGFSGGKDSTVLLQLVWLAISEIPLEYRKREVHVVCNDTLVENPIIQSYVYGVLSKIKEAAASMSMPIRVETTIPRLEDTFWVNIIGRGYPVPNNSFRWCTDKMKIKPTSRFLTDKVAENGEAIILIGTRSSESANRAKSIKKHEIRGKRLTKHPHNPNTFVYSPIKELMLEEVWYIINTMTSPWGADNSKLFQIYLDASADDYECPTVVTDKSHSSCGQSRFGCWTCTVVKEDKSLSALVNKGQSWLKPLLDLRQSMIDERNISKNRLPIRRNLQNAVNSDGDNLGTYEPEYRIKLLKQVLNAQRVVQNEKPETTLITNQELVAIQVIWHRDAAYYNIKFSETVSQIYNKIYDKEIEMEKHAEKIQREIDLLKSVCTDEPSDFDLINELLALQRNKALLNRKRGLKEDIERVIEKYLN
ncbi:DNA phosphorothioation system sulfurtransferase DndC [Dysgonomonas sp. 25]|uniref:DNA phosphorothioation system sulfurtransferase DndC n=1 Tax=Dysgonomonas sp. 25 TaxID=2302933 RepID=UPI0013D6E985|nr:DNA phosphorothioation system sulfurtransferase DndC [Dysgonomonas sp. 25]NDV70385.1 DNA phosphorothioation system sulfurtransferase DndC [Dysgonomonas sp. 25]